MREFSHAARIISPGLAIGKAFLVVEPPSVQDEARQINVEAELKRFNNQVNHIASELSKLFLRISKQINVKDAEIIQTQQMILSDEGFKNKVMALISDELLPVEIAVERVMKNFSQRFAASANELMRERAMDFIDLAKYFKNKKMYPLDAAHQQTFKDAVLVVGDLFPSIVLEGNKLSVKGILAENGAPTSHAAILARSFGIPVLITPPKLIRLIKDGTEVILDGLKGQIKLNPRLQTLNQYKKQHTMIEQISKSYDRIRKLPAKTLDGTTIDLNVNIERLDELPLFSPNEVQGIGLFRTEFLFMFDQANFPSFEKQVQWYEKVVRFMDGKPVTFRVLDVGGDKFLPYFSMGKQSNPYLGLRAHRLFQYHPEILATQLKAILQASRLGPVKILYPMINCLEEIEYLNKILNSVASDEFDYEIGIMIETPAAVFLIRDLMLHVDFVSIGTNDLVQYALTVDRNNENVMSFYKPMHPLILRMLKQIITAAKSFGKPVAICGEVASDPHWTPLLLGLGIRSLSMAPLLVPPIKNQILSLDINHCEALATKALKTNYESEVVRYVDEFFQYQEDAYKSG